MKWPLFASLILLQLSNIAVAQACDSLGGFRIFDATAYTGKPDLSKYGIMYLPAVSSFWRPSPPSEGPPSLRQVRRAIDVDQIDTNSAKEIYVNIEHWPLRGNVSVVYDSLIKYRDVIKKVKSELPDSKVGIYSLVPIRDYWGAIKPEESTEFRGWRQENDRLSILASEIDFLLPSLYTFYPDMFGWEKYAIANLQEARRISQGKPVYAFLWPQYHDSNVLLNSTYIPRKFWRQQLETVRKHADGVVIWGGWSFRGKPRILSWEDDMGWWQETLDWLHCSQDGDSHDASPANIKNTELQGVIDKSIRDHHVGSRFTGPYFDGGMKFYRVECENGELGSLINDGTAWKFGEKVFSSTTEINEVLRQICH